MTPDTSQMQIPLRSCSTFNKPTRLSKRILADSAVCFNGVFFVVAPTLKPGAGLACSDDINGECREDRSGQHSQQQNQVEPVLNRASLLSHLTEAPRVTVESLFFMAHTLHKPNRTVRTVAEKI